MKVNIIELYKLMQKIFINNKLSDSQAKDISDVLLYAELSGKETQGIIKFMGTEPIQKIIPLYNPKKVKDTKLSALIDGGRNSGILVSRIATKLVIKKCKKNGFAIVGTNNSYASTGTLGFYANEIAKHNLIGIVMSGTPKGVALYGSRDKQVGINPIAFGFPTEKDPLIFDMATAAITWYGLVRAQMLGKEIPDGVAIDSEGNGTKDPTKAMKGAILTFGNDYKGSGLNLMIEMLTGPLVGAMDTKDGNGSLFIAIDPDLLIGGENFKKNSSRVLSNIKKSRASKAFKEVMLPGEKALNRRKNAIASETIEIDDKIYSDFLEVVNK